MCSLCEFHIRFFLYYFIQMYSLQWVTCVILIFAASVHFSHKYLSYLYRCTIKIKFSYQNCWNIVDFSVTEKILYLLDFCIHFCAPYIGLGTEIIILKFLVFVIWFVIYGYTKKLWMFTNTLSIYLILAYLKKTIWVFYKMYLLYNIK